MGILYGTSTIAQQKRGEAIATLNAAIRRTQEYLGELRASRDTLLAQADSAGEQAEDPQLDRVLDAASAHPAHQEFPDDTCGEQHPALDPDDAFEQRLLQDATEPGRDYFE